MENNFSILVASCVSLLNSSNTKDYASFSFVLNGIGISSMVIFGIIGNMITIVVLRFKSMKAKINQYLIALALSDIMVLCTCFILFGWSALLYGVEPATGVTFSYINFIFYPVSNTCRTASVWILLVTTVERFRAICFPLHHRITATQRQGRAILIVVCFAAILVNIPRWFELSIGICPKQVLGLHLGNLVGDVILVMSDLRANSHYYFVYHVIIQQIFITIGPFILQLVLTILIHRKMRNSNSHSDSFGEQMTRQRQSQRGRKQLEDNMTKMLLVVAGKFLLCLLLPVAVDSYEAVSTAMASQFDENFGYYVDISTFLVVINSSVNFIIYMICCPGFKKKVLRDRPTLICRKSEPLQAATEKDRCLALERVKKRAPRTTLSTTL